MGEMAAQTCWLDVIGVVGGHDLLEGLEVTVVE
jgi:hypothetical protein